MAGVQPFFLELMDTPAVDVEGTAAAVVEEEEAVWGAVSGMDDGTDVSSSSSSSSSSSGAGSWGWGWGHIFCLNCKHKKKHGKYNGK